MIEYFENENEHFFRGMSLFIVTESAQSKYLVKLIDFVSVEKIPEEEKAQRDPGLVKGLKSIDTLLQKIHDGNE